MNIESTKRLELAKKAGQILSQTDDFVGQMVIVFGTVGLGTARGDSDTDVAVVVPDNFSTETMRLHSRYSEALRRANIPVDWEQAGRIHLQVYTQSEFNENNNFSRSVRNSARKVWPKQSQ